MRPMRRSVSSLIRRLKEKTIINPMTGCWEWQGSRNRLGYGRIRWVEEEYRVHRLAAYISLGLDLNDKRQCALHKCDNPCCWYWAHLFVGTKHDNIMDMVVKGKSWGSWNR
jgi:hypothetical protein